MAIMQWEQLFSDYRKIKTTHTGQIFNILKIISLDSDEIKHTKILTWLLDEKANHGQKRLFFDAFTQLTKISCSVLSSYSVKTEHQESEARTDIVIHEAGNFAIFIEVKVAASEGENQCPREYADLEIFAKRQNIPKDKIFAVFLTPEGRKPESGATGWRLLSWTDLRQKFVTLIDSDIKPGKLHDTVNDWLDVISDFTEGTMDLKSKEAEILINNYHTVSEIIADNNRLQTGIFDFLLSLKGDLENKAWWKDGWEFSHHPRKKHEIFIIKNSWRYANKDPKVAIGVENFNAANLFTDIDAQAPNLYIYVYENVEKRDQLVDAIAQALYSKKKILIGDNTKATGYPLKRFGLKFKPTSGLDFDGNLRPIIISFIEDYSQFLGSTSLDRVISNW